MLAASAEHPFSLTFGLHPERMMPALSRRGLEDMNVPEEIRKCVLFLGTKLGRRFVPRATAFLVA
jgi:hypothetical protein